MSLSEFAPKVTFSRLNLQQKQSRVCSVGVVFTCRVNCPARTAQKASVLHECFDQIGPDGVDKWSLRRIKPQHTCRTCLVFLWHCCRIEGDVTLSILKWSLLDHCSPKKSVAHAVSGPCDSRLVPCCTSPCVTATQPHGLHSQ